MNYLKKEFEGEDLSTFKALYLKGSPTLDIVCSNYDQDYSNIELTGQDANF